MTNTFVWFVLYLLHSSGCFVPILHHKVTVWLLVQRDVGWESMGGATFFFLKQQRDRLPLPPNPPISPPTLYFAL